MNIPLSRAALLWNVNGMARSDTHPLNFRHRDMAYSVGAVFSEYKSWPDDDKKISLLVNAIQAIVRDGVDPLSMLFALQRIEGMAELFSADCNAELLIMEKAANGKDGL